jgi:alpha-glucosidase (family GH31 glycosyl hydrolase)
MTGMPPFGSLALFERFRDEGWLVMDADGAAVLFPWGRGLGGLVDFTNPGAVQAHRELIRRVVALGARGFKLDYGEAVRPSLLGFTPNTLMRFTDGSTPEVQHTRYARLYHEAFLSVLRERWPDDHFVITRTGGIYDQKNGVALWPGDLDNDFSRHGAPAPDGKLAVGGLPAAVSGALSTSMSGYPLYGSDIGGYRGGAPTTEVLLRWAELGAVSTIMQLGGGGTGDVTHNPWDPRYGPEAVEGYRRCARLHMDLVPTLEALLVRATSDGTPVLVPVGVWTEDDEEAWSDGETFLVGRDLLAAPVVEAARQRRVRFPSGTWIGWWRGDVHEGPRTEVVDAPLGELPLFFRSGAVIALGDPRLATWAPASDPAVAGPEEYGEALGVRTSAGPDGDLRLRDGTVITQRSAGGGSTVRVTSPAERLVVVDFHSPATQARVNGAVPDEVAGEDALWTCAGACAWRQGTRTWVSAVGREVIVEYR